MRRARIASVKASTAHRACVWLWQSRWPTRDSTEVGAEFDIYETNWLQTGTRAMVTNMIVSDETKEVGQGEGVGGWQDVSLTVKLTHQRAAPDGGDDSWVLTWLSAMRRVRSARVKASAACSAWVWQSSSMTATQRSNSDMVSSNCRHSNVMSSSSTLRRVSWARARSRHDPSWRTAHTHNSNTVRRVSPQDLEPTTNDPPISRTVARFIHAPDQDPPVPALDSAGCSCGCRIPALLWLYSEFGTDCKLLLGPIINYKLARRKSLSASERMLYLDH